ncbi:DPH4 homolog [Oppia nitens]|uniref:DPH4 homolog n=1 Tax=Oppia nitens TaxID=1686743 RepID=UPI0023DABD8C|nr:DPH4 homolog [Oppia nitens]
MTSKDVSTHYETLNCNENATKEEIRNQFKKLALQTHPDKSDSKTSCEDFHRIDYALKVLATDESRRQYDCQLIDDRSYDRIINQEITINDMILIDDTYSIDCCCGGSYLISIDDFSQLSSVESPQESLIIDCNSCSLSVKLGKT